MYAALREHQVALCLADTDEEEPDVEATADWGYLRLRRAAYSVESSSSSGTLAKLGSP